jgi:hypothetical protein
MHPIIRISLVVAALTGAWLVGRAMWPAVAKNLIARRSWTRTDGEVRAMNGAIGFELGREPSAYRAFAKVDHTWGLRLFGRAALFVDPADPSHIQPAGFLQMWLAPAEMSALILILVATSLIAALLGTGQGVVRAEGGQTQARWVFTPSPGPLGNGISLRSPTRQWKIVMSWSLLGAAMAIIVLLGKGDNRTAGSYYITLGAAFAMALWIFAWHTKTMEVSANGQGIRMTSVLGWRDVPWEMIGGAKEQEIFTTYYNSNMRMWEMPFPGSTARVIAFNDRQGRTLMSFSSELEPQGGLKQLFELCAQQTGSRLLRRKIAIHL